LKLAIFANGIVSTKIGGAQKHMREVIQLFPEYYDIFLFPEPQMFGNKDIIDLRFVNEMQAKGIKISPYFLDNYKTNPGINEIMKNYSSEIKKCDFIYDMNFQYYLDNIKYGGAISLQLSIMNDIPMGVCIQDMGDITSYTFDSFASIIKLSVMAKGITWFIVSAGIYNLLNRKITVRKLLACKKLSFITIVNNEYKKNLRIPFENIYLLNPSNAIDNEIKLHRTEEKNNQVIFYARLIYQKGLFDIVYVHKRMLESYRIKLIISGKFQREFEKKEFFRLVKKLGLENWIEYVGVLSDRDLYSELSRSKLMIYPSHSDSFSISVLQALFLHVPVVAYDIPGLSLYKNFKCVSMVKEFDTESMAEKAIEFLNTEENLFEQPELSKFIDNHSSWKFIAESHLSAIKNNLRRQ
jgi:glycosyltransferase involved in cell wall biosynthesis